MIAWRWQSMIGGAGRTVIHNGNGTDATDGNGCNGNNWIGQHSTNGGYTGQRGKTLLTGLVLPKVGDLSLNVTPN